MPAVPQHISRLFFIEGDLLLPLVLNAVLFKKKMPDNISLFDRPVEDLIAVLWFYLCIKNALGLDPHQRPHLAESVASALFHSNLAVPMRDLRSEMHFHVRVFFHQFAHTLINLPGTSGQAACPGADEDPAPAVLDLCF